MVFGRQVRLDKGAVAGLTSKYRENSP